MLNKIHNNVHSMIAEAREIMQQHLSPAKANQDKGPRTLSPLTAALKRREEEVRLGQNDRNYLDSQFIGQLLRKKRTITEPVSRSMNEPATLGGSLNRSRKKQLSTLIPGESQLLSTRIYGFHKESIHRKCQTQFLPYIKTKLSRAVKKSLVRQKDKTSNISQSSSLANQRYPPGITKTIDAWEDILIESSARKGVQFKIVAKKKSQERGEKALAHKKKPLEDVSPEPWQFKDQDDYYE